MKETFDSQEFEKIKKRATALKTASAKKLTMFQEISDMYQMESGDTKVSGRDKDDVKLTISPSARNEVVGMVRLLTTSNPHFKGTSEKGLDPNKAEKALETILKRSNELKQAKVETECARCAVLYGEVHLMVENVADLMAIDTLPDMEKERLAEIQRRTPFIIEAVSPMEGYPDFGRFGLRAYLRYYKATGADITERWGEQNPALKDDQEYNVNDWYGAEWRAVWLDEQKDPLSFGKHGMKRIPYVVRLSDGTELFKDQDKKRQPFLYAKWKGNLWKRENLLLTTLFTSMFERGTGPLAAIDKDSLPDDQTLTINYQGAFRYIIGKAQLINDKAFDRDLIEAKALLDQVGGESTIYKQTLGEAAGGGQTPFSSLSLLSQSGRLPLTSPQDAVSEAFKQASYIMLRWITDENIENSLIKANEIPDDLELECTMEVKLPQDMFRNAQVAAQLGNTVSMEWKRSNLLQISDSDKMTEQVWGEQAAELFYQAMAQQFVERAKQAMQQQAQQQAMQQQAQQQAQAQPQMQGQSQQPMMPPGNEMPPIAGPDAAMAGGGQMPMTEPMIPPGEQVQRGRA